MLKDNSEKICQRVEQTYKRDLKYIIEKTRDSKNQYGRGSCIQRISLRKKEKMNEQQKKLDVRDY